MGFDIAEYLADLSKFELLEVFYLARDALIGDVTIYMSVVFAYISLAHFAGSKLKTFYAVMISIIYSFFALFLVSSIYNSSLTLTVIGSAIIGAQNSWEPIVLAAFLLLTWAFSIVMFVQNQREGMPEATVD